MSNADDSLRAALRAFHDGRITEALALSEVLPPMERLLMQIRSLIRLNALEDALNLVYSSERQFIEDSTDAQRALYEALKAYLVNFLVGYREAKVCYSNARAYAFSTESDELVLEVLGWQARSAAFAEDPQSVDRFTELLLERGGARVRVIARSIRAHRLLGAHDVIGQLVLVHENSRDLETLPYDGYLKAINIQNRALLESQIGSLSGVKSARAVAEQFKWPSDLRRAEVLTFASLADGAAGFADFASEESALSRLQSLSGIGHAQTAFAIRKTRVAANQGRLDRVAEYLTKLDRLLEPENSRDNETDLFLLVSDVAAVNVAAARYLFEKIHALTQGRYKFLAVPESRIEASRNQALGMIKFFSGDFSASKAMLEPAYFHFLACRMPEPTASLALPLSLMTGSDYYRLHSDQLSGPNANLQTERHLRFYRDRTLKGSLYVD